MPVAARGAAASRSRHQARVHRAVGPLEQPEPDLGAGGVERLADEAAAGIVDRHDAGPRPGSSSTSLR